MKYARFGKTGREVSAICLGTMTFGASCDEAASAAIVRRALDLGVTFFDTAPMYAAGTAEEHLGKAIRGERDRLFLATKVHAGFDRATVVGSLEASLKRMGTDRVDLFLIHWPAVGMNLTEMMGSLDEAVRSGKALHVGVCNFPAWLLASSNAVAAERGWPRLVCNQVAYNLIERGVEVEVLPQAVTEGIAITAYRPVAMGLLAGAYANGTPIPEGLRGKADPRVITWLSQYGAAVDRFNSFATRKGVRPAQLALAWIRHAGAVTCPIAGASSVAQVEEAAASVDAALTDAEHEELALMFGAEVKEEGLQLFPGLKYNYPRLRRRLGLAVRE